MSILYAIVKTSWAQPNPVLLAHNIATNITHIYNARKYCYNASEMQCMMF